MVELVFLVANRWEGEDLVKDRWEAVLDQIPLLLAVCSKNQLKNHQLHSLQQLVFFELDSFIAKWDEGTIQPTLKVEFTNSLSLCLLVEGS